MFDSAKNARRLLIVEDDQATRFALSRILMSAGYEVTTAETVREAKVQWTGHPLILLDLHLPDGSGVDLLNSLQGASHPMPRVGICSAAMEPELKAVTRTYGPLRIFRKPIDLDAVLSWLAENPAH